MSQTASVLISGGGVAGSALAYWLRHHGFAPTVVERAPTLQRGGYAVDFRGAVHLRVLREMGVLHDIESRQTGLRSLTLVDRESRPLARVPAEVFAGDVEILRGDLVDVLYRATRARAQYIFDDTIASLHDDDCGVHVTFQRSPPRTFDLVIGADGVHSTVRRLGFADESRCRRPLGMHVAIFTGPNSLDLDHAGLIHSAPDRTVSVFSARANRESIVVVQFRGMPDQFDPQDPDRQRSCVSHIIAEMGWEVGALQEALGATKDFYFDATEQIRLDCWSKGRISLVGDAGYAAGPGGNGTGTAVVAAYVLAGELARAPGDHALAFSRYEARLREYVEAAQHQGADAREYVIPSTWKQIRWRNRFFRMVGFLPVTGFIRWMSRRSATQLDLPSYEAASSE